MYVFVIHWVDTFFYIADSQINLINSQDKYTKDLSFLNVSSN